VFSFNKRIQSQVLELTHVDLRARVLRSHLVLGWSQAHLDQVWFELSWRWKSTRRLRFRFV